MRSQFSHSRQERTMVLNSNQNDLEDMQRHHSTKSNGSADLCPLICPDSASMDCISETGHGNTYNSFRRRTSQRQVPHMNRLESSISISSLNATMPHMEERMRRRLKYFFMNPCQKYKAKRRKPFKLVIQLLKIALVTIQLNLFGSNNQTLVDFKLENEAVFSSVFMSQNRSFYSKSEVYSQINNIRKEYALWTNNTVGIFDYPTNNIAETFKVTKNRKVNDSPPVVMCISKYVDVDNNPATLAFDFDQDDIRRSCMSMKIWNQDESTLQTDGVPLNNGSKYYIDFIRLNSVDIRLHFVTMQVKTPLGFTPPTCFNVSLEILLQNELHSGRIPPSLSSEYHMTNCNNETAHPVNGMKVFLNVFDSIIIVTCLLSLILCARSLWKAQILRRIFEKFFSAQYNKQLSFSDQLEFFNMWYLLIIISDVLTILGSLSKMILQNKDTGIVDYNLCSIFLGVGCLCVWVGVLRYAGFFKQYNILVLTLKKALPHVCRFMVCASLLYLGFMFCGWVVLGPHHHKFRSLVVTSEALFSLINGDDMYMTFEEMSKKSTGMVVFSQVYLYTFISLFIYVVLSLFIAVIMDTYETIKEWQDRDEPQQTELEKFIAPCTADASVENYGFDGLNSPTRCCFCCFGGNDEDFETDDEILDE